jgi:hypothetical protein
MVQAKKIFSKRCHSFEFAIRTLKDALAQIESSVIERYVENDPTPNSKQKLRQLL